MQLPKSHNYHEVTLTSHLAIAGTEAAMLTCGQKPWDLIIHKTQVKLREYGHYNLADRFLTTW